MCNKYCCKTNVQIDSFHLERIEKKERIDLASMIFPNSYADREGIEKRNTSSICSLLRLSHLMHPVFVIELVESSFLLPGSHTTTQAQLRSHLSITARCHPRQPPKQRSGGKPIGTFLPTLPTGSSLILLTPPTQISIRSETFIFGTVTIKDFHHNFRDYSAVWDLEVEYSGA